MSTQEYTEKTYEDFFEEVWDYVSMHIVSDEMWEKHLSKFQELTFDLYRFYKMTVPTEPLSELSENAAIKLYSRIIESFVKNFSKELS